MAEELRHSRPFAFLSHGLDVATGGLDDEIIGAGLAATRDDIDYEDAQRALDDATAMSGEEHPWTARAGTAAGILASVPISEALMPRAVAGAPALANVARSTAAPAAIGATLGTVGGALHARPGHRAEDAAIGGATGLLFGAGGGALVGGGRLLTLGRSTLPATLAGGAAEGAGYGLLATPGTSRANILQGRDLANEGLQNATIGAGMGAGISALGSVLSRPARSLAGASEQAQIPAQLSDTRAPSTFDEAAFDLQLAGWRERRQGEAERVQHPRPIMAARVGG